MVTKGVSLFLAVTVVLLCVIVGNYMREGPVRSFMKWCRSYVIQAYQKRKEELEQMEMQYGVFPEKGLLCRLDRLLEEAGIRKVYNMITAETYLTIVIVTMAVVGLLVWIVWRNLTFFLCSSLCISFVYGVILYLKAGERYKKTEKQLLIFINLLDNYSKTSDELVEIVARSEKLLEEPLKSAISEFHWEAVHTGEIETALRHLSVKLPHRKLKEIIRNLDICRKHEANYAEIIKDIRVNMKEYLHAKEERKTIRQTARMNTLVMCLVGTFILNLVNGFMENQLWQMLLQSSFGTAILLYLFILAMIAVVSFIKIDKA